jgi:hypothetical protein
MLIDKIRIERTAEFASVVAQVTWETKDRPSFELYIATQPEYADGLSAKADVFLPACSMLAAWYGEARLKIDGSVCPLLFEGAVASLRTLYAYEGWQTSLPVLEVQFDQAAPARPHERTGLFLSRGVDSLFELKRNLDLVPRGHPYAIQDALHVQGAGFPEDGSFTLNAQAFDKIRRKFSAIAEDTGVNVIPVLSNLHQISPVHDRDFGAFWRNHFHTVAIGSVAQAFSGRLTRIIVASSTPAWTRVPGVSDLPYNCSSTNLQVIYFPSFTRFEKTKAISEWPMALDNLLVCTKNSSTNCGECLKCVWARIALAALGIKSKQFGGGDLDPRQISQTVLITPSQYIDDYPILLEPLRAAGELELMAAIEEMLARAAPWDTWREGLINDLSTCVPAGSPFILVDDDALQINGLTQDRPATPFLERDGQYWGSPPDDDTAIAEIGRLRTGGAEFLAVAWPSAWWFDAYPRWSAHLRERFTCVLERPGVTIFDLRIGG